MFLLKRAKRTSISARERNQGTNDNLSNPEMLNGLITVVTGSCTPVHGDSFKKNTSQYRKCELSGNTYIPFNDDTILVFDRNIKENYADIVRKIIGFTNRFISQSKAERLVCELVDVISKDKGISDT